jgi:hypothetical protein
MTTFSRQRPKLAEQDQDKFTCWAAALESWMDVTPQSPLRWAIKTQDDAISQYKMFCGTKDGLEMPWGFQIMAAGVGMDFKVFLDPRHLTGAFLYWKLKTKGHLYFFVARWGVAHAGVIYQIANPWRKSCTISFMDPWPGHGYRIDDSLEHVREARVACIGWPA